MLIPLIRGYAPLQLLLLYTLPRLILARVDITPLTFEDFTYIFNLYPLEGNGGCGRNTPDGVPMLEHTYKSLGGALAMARTVILDLLNYPTQPYIRGLLYLFFGITFQWDHQLNPDADNMAAFSFISNTFGVVNQVFPKPTVNPHNIKPRYRCLEDYAAYKTHLKIANGSEVQVGEWFDIISEGGFTRSPPYNDIWPGMMYVDNIFDNTRGWYLPDANDPPNGLCGILSPQSLVVNAMFTDSHFTTRDDQISLAQAIFGMTACPIHFNFPTLLDLGAPVPNGEPSEIRKFQESADMHDLHELFHLVSGGAITDMPAVTPPVADPINTYEWVLDRDFASWIPNAAIPAYGYFYTMFLGLARPLDARVNADNFAIFALCMYFKELNCLGAFESDIRTKK